MCQGGVVERADHLRYLTRLAEMEMFDRDRRVMDRRIKAAARFPTVKKPRQFRFPGVAII